MDEGTLDKLMIAIELDPSKFEEGRKKLDTAFKAARDEARKSGESIEGSGKLANKFFDEITTRALKLGTVLLGGAGLGEFIQKSIQSGSALGYMSKNIGISSKELFTFQTAVRAVGGDADNVAPAILGLSQALATIQLRGKGSEELISAFQFLGITDFIDHATGKVKTVAQLLPEIQKGLADTAQKFGAPIAYNLGKTLGLTDDLINLFLSPEAQQYLDRAKKVSEVNDKQTRSFQRLIGEWGVFKGALQGVGYEVASQLVDAVDRFGRGWDNATNALREFIEEHETLKKAMEELENDPLMKKIIKEEAPYAESDAGAAIGGSIGAIVGSFVPVVGTAIGAAAGVVIGGSLGAADAARRKSNEEASAPAQAPSKAPLGSSRLSLEQVFSVISQIEGAKEKTITATGSPRTPFAYGKNQITLETAQQFDKNVTVDKLLDAKYNDALARKIEEKYYRKYNGNLAAIEVAYNAGEGAADRYVKAGGNSAAAGLLPETVAYISKGNKLTGGGQPNTSTSTVNIQNINVHAPNARDSDGIAVSIRQELSDYQLLSQGNAGPQ